MSPSMPKRQTSAVSRAGNYPRSRLWIQRYVGVGVGHCIQSQPMSLDRCQGQPKGLRRLDSFAMNEDFVHTGVSIQWIRWSPEEVR